MNTHTYKPGDTYYYVDITVVGTDGAATLQTLKVVRVTPGRVYLSSYAPGCCGTCGSGYYLDASDMGLARRRWGATAESALKRALQIEKGLLADLERKATCRRKTVKSLEQQLAGVHTLPMFDGPPVVAGCTCVTEPNPSCPQHGDKS